MDGVGCTPLWIICLKQFYQVFLIQKLIVFSYLRNSSIFVVAKLYLLWISSAVMWRPLIMFRKKLSASIFTTCDRKYTLNHINLFQIATRQFFKIYFAIIHLTVGLSNDLCNADRQECWRDFSSLTITTQSTQIINTGLLGMIGFIV